MMCLRTLLCTGIFGLILYSSVSLGEDSVQQPARRYLRTEAVYNIPDLSLVDKNGNDVRLRQLIDYGGPVMLQFIFASCSTVCPILSASFSSAQSNLDQIDNGVYRLISISIDPEQDTPETLTDYAKRFKAGKNWYFLTGSRNDIAGILKAFDAAYTGSNKMFHKSLTLIHSGKKSKWVRVEGLLGKKDIITEYQKIIGLSDSF